MFSISVVMGSCGVTRYVPQGGYLLNRNVIHTDKNTPRRERVTEEELDRFIRQPHTRKFLRTNLPSAIYAASDTSRNNLSNRLLRKLGSPPVILDSAMIARSAGNIESYLRSRGYYDSQLDWRVDARGKKAKVTYTVTQGEPYRIAKVDYRFRDEFLRPVLTPDLEKNSIVREGVIFDMGTLNAERSRIAAFLRNRGYYNFTVNNLTYIADSTRGDRTVDLTMVVNQYLTGYNDLGEPEYVNNTIYRISDIYLDPDYDPVAAVSDPRYYAQMDTLNYHGLNILSHGRPKVRARALRRAINLYPNYFYDEQSVQEAYSEIMRMGYFRSAAMIFDDVTDTAKVNPVTYIGEGDDTDHELSEVRHTTREGYLKCTINCIPSLRQSYKIELEGSMSSNFFALGAALGYQNRNLFHGAELFEAGLAGRYEFLRTTGRTGSYEIGGSMAVTLPRFLLPINPDRRNSTLNKRTKFEMSIDYQDRPVYKRTLSGVRLAYGWNNRSNSSFAIRPVDVSLINARDIDLDFLAGLQNPYLQQSYQSQLAPGISMSYIYNSQLRRLDVNSNSVVFRLNAETMGNLFAAVSRLTSEPNYDPTVGGWYYKAFGMRFSQYVRAEASISNRIVTGSKTSFVWRILAGGAASYGNSTPMPYEKFFYSGGSNSMRGWIVRRLGPGTQPYDNSKYPSQIGNLKLEANIEFRFPVWDFIHSAMFLDLGNIWFAGKDNYDDPDLSETAVFRLGTFYKQLGLNTGLGLRFDFGRFIFRVDWGIKLHDPGQSPGNRWIIKNFRLNNSALNFGVGYPF